jgi:putative tryptophan/tyrosine transport system substrate-binding protein
MEKAIWIGSLSGPNLKSKTCPEPSRRIQNLKWAGFLVILVLLVGYVGMAEAQQSAKLPRIGLLIPGSQSAFSTRMDAFRKGLRELGYVEGQNIVIERRFAEEKTDRLPDLADDLLRAKADVIVTVSTPGVLAAKKASGTIPIIFAGITDPITSGLVASFARPGGNVTGLTNISQELDGKRLELLKETFPKTARVAYLWSKNSPKTDMEVVAHTLGLRLQTLILETAADFDNAFEAAIKGRTQALTMSPSPLFITYRKRIVEFAATNKMPGIYPTSDFVEVGGLMAYGHSSLENWHRTATYVDKILKGAKPADLPVEQPSKFELVINLKTAKQIGVTIPPNVLARADKVIK